MRSRELLSKLLDSCTTLNSTTQFHAFLLRAGHLSPDCCYFPTKLTSSYARHASISHARKLFDETPHPNTFLWNAILRAHSRAHQWDAALRLFRRMVAATSSSSSPPDAFTLPIVLKSCAALGALAPGRAIHAVAVKNSTAHLDVFVGAAIVEMYAKCGEMGEAVRVFGELPETDVVVWTTVISGFQQNGYAQEAVGFFSRMVVESGLPSDPVTLVSLVSALTQLGDLLGGKCCHGFIIRVWDFDQDLSLNNSILNLYAKLGAVAAAKTLFESMRDRDVISWSTMIAGYAKSGSGIEALNLYQRMVEVGLEPNSITVIAVLQACGLALDAEEGKRVHKVAFRKGFELDAAVSTALIDMYMKCSCCNEAMNLFHRMPDKDVVSWAAVIGGCADNGFVNESLELFRSMLVTGTTPDAVTMVKVLAACSQLGALHQALCLHGFLIHSGFDDKVFVGAALIDLYAKCGNIDDAITVFESMNEKDVVLWSSMIASYGIHGLGNEAMMTFERMIEASVRPNNVTLVSILSACSHAGLVEDGRMIFNNMHNGYDIIPDSEHYGIMVDMLGRAGDLHGAMRLIEEMPKPVSPHVWCAMLAGCRIHQNTELGEKVAKILLKLDPHHGGYYNLLLNIYASGEKWNSLVEVKKIMGKRGLRKTPGRSSVEVGNKVQSLLAGDMLHKGWEEIRDLITKSELKVRKEGHGSTERYVVRPLERGTVVRYCL